MAALDIKNLQKKIRQNAARYSPYAFMVLAIVLFAIMFLNIRKISRPSVNESRLEEKLSGVQSQRVKLDQETIDEVRRRSVQGPSTEPTATGDSNPFD